MILGDLVGKTAQAGTRMYRRADVRGAVIKVRQFNFRAMQIAQQEDRHDDADMHLAKVRTAIAILNELNEDCPVFINSEAVDGHIPMIAAADDGGR